MNINMFQGGSFSFLLLILLSFILVRLGVNISFFNAIPNILFTLCYPATIISTLAGLSKDFLLKNAAFAIGFSLVSTLVIFAVAQLALLRYKNTGRKEIIVFCLMVGNITFAGLPFIQLFFGQWGLGLAMLFGAAQDVLIWTVCYWMFSGKKGLREAGKALLNPCFFALLLGAVLLLTSFSIPPFFMQPIQLLANTTSPLALLCIGASLAQSKNVFKKLSPAAVLLALVKVLLLPALVFSLLVLLGSPLQQAMFYAFLCALPAPLLSLIFAKQFAKDGSFAAQNFVLSTTLFFALCCVAYYIQQGI